MKKLTLLTILSLVLTSCTHVFFIDPQPKESTELSELPIEIFGKWDNEYGGIHINAERITMYDLVRDSLGNITDTNFTLNPLSDSLRLYKVEDFYVFNMSEYNNYWEVAILKKEINGDLVTYFIADPKALLDNDELKVIEANYLVGEEEILLPELNPEYDENDFLLHVVLSGQMSVSSLRKMMIPENILYIFKPDGRLLYPDDVLEGE